MANQDNPSFWGLKLTNGLNYSTIVNQPFRISSAALDFESGYKKGIISVIFENEGQEHVLCNLSADHNILQVALDLQFCEEDKLCFSLRGENGGVYLTGYYLTDVDELGFGEEESDEVDSDVKRKDALQWVKEVSKGAKNSKLDSSSNNTPVNNKRKLPHDAPSAKKTKTGIFSSLSELMNGDHHSEDDADFEVDEEALGSDESYNEFDEDELLDEAKELMNGDDQTDEEDYNEQSLVLSETSTHSPKSVQSSTPMTAEKSKKMKKKKRILARKLARAQNTSLGSEHEGPENINTSIEQNKSPQNNTSFGKNKSPKNIRTSEGQHKSPQNLKSPGGQQNKSPKNMTPGGQQNKSPKNMTPGGQQNKTPKNMTPGGQQNKSPKNMTPGGQQNKSPKNMTPGGQQNKTPKNMTPGGQRNKTPKNMTPRGQQNKNPQHMTPGVQQNKTPQNIKTPGVKGHKNVNTPSEEKTPQNQKSPKSTATRTPKSSTKKIKILIE